MISPSASRREFLKNLPRGLLNGIRSITTAMSLSATEMADNNNGVVDEPRIARIDITRCLAWGGANCQLCYLACPLRDRAILIEDQKPVIVFSACDGCAMCEAVCHTVNDLSAIEMVPLKS